MNNPPKLIPVTLKVLGVLWVASAGYLLYGVYGNWFMIHKLYADAIARNPELGPPLVRQAVFFGITGTLAVVVGFGLFRPRKFVWWLALALCPGTGWWFLSELPGLLFSGSVQGLWIFLSYLALYGFTFVYLLLPFQRALFGIGRAQSPTMRSSELPPADAAGSRSP